MIIILTFIAFTGLVALISWYKTKEENLSTKEGYFLAGRGLTGLVIAGSLEMTNLSTEQLVGQAGQSYSTNMGAMSWSVNASIALLALALIFLPKYLKAGAGLQPDFPSGSAARHHDLSEHCDPVCCNRRYRFDLRDLRRPEGSCGI